MLGCMAEFERDLYPRCTGDASRMANARAVNRDAAQRLRRSGKP
jgi:hypothetical protein